jgi:hypothetical protein
VRSGGGAAGSSVAGSGVYVNCGIEEGGFGCEHRDRERAQNVEIAAIRQAGSTFYTA